MNALAVFAHPDDETMLCGGTLALLAKEGWKVHYLCATRGEGGEVGDPPVCSIEDLVGQVSVPEVILLEESLHRVYPQLKAGQAPDDVLIQSLSKYRKD